jgi:hypothetical protein
MAKRYLVIIPVHKEPYMKSFNDMNKANNIMQEKLGLMIAESDVIGFERPMVIRSAHARKKSSLQVNDRATFFAKLPSAEDDIFGTAIIIGKTDGEIIGLTEKAAREVIDAINNLEPDTHE